MKRIKKVKQKQAVCLCGSNDLRPLFLQVYGCNTDILTRDFDRRYKWDCRNCGSEFFACKDEEDYWSSSFVNSISVRKESTWPEDLMKQWGKELPAKKIVVLEEDRR